jgi:hypothetical protein
MATFNKFFQFPEDLAHKVHDFSTHQLKVALSNTPPASSNTVLANITQISYANLSSRDIVTASSGQTAGEYKLVCDDLVLTSSGGSTGPFRYVVIYNNTPTSPLAPLIGWYDYGSAITLASAETLTLDFDGVNGLLTINNT